MRPFRAGRDGFLLVEALAALALGALILVALLSLAGLMRRSADRAAASLETVEVSTRTVDAIAREIRQAVPRRFAATPEDKAAAAGPPQSGPTRSPSGAPSQTSTSSSQQAGAAPAPPRESLSGEAEDAGRQAAGGQAAGQADAALENKRPFVFLGAPDRLLFAMNPVQPTGLRAPVVVVYQLEEAGATLRAEAPLPSSATGPDELRLGPVARIDPGPERLRFAFVDRQPSGDEIILDAWTAPTRMPAAVRIERIDPRSSATLGMLRVPFLIDGEPGCADTGKGACARGESASAAASAAAGAAGAAAAPQQQQESAQ